ncbi:galactoside transport protein [Bifidobacterium lemurum]|uniref:Galactoside transport protein n=1 Tax=Bifidobacterium lemurum TaxID=1603886 RepID=A0A261FUC8_9BIFI|nr:glycoside-pentoside-hexuronide (GPH):cation symporter [Bifidobacterium lemurum]OZG62779.1 galactoside transport protein [Bifidobacterium lemurum]QOL34512.1 MFS transporter [Bifidobacterium lemurum]
MSDHQEQSSVPASTRGNLGRRVAYAFGNLGQAAFYNALSTYFVVYVTSVLFVNVDKGTATKLIGLITGLIVVIRIAEIFLDPLLGNIIDNTTTRFGRFRPWQFIGGLVSAVLLVMVYTGLFGLVNVNQTWFIVLFVIVFIVLDVFYSMRDISYWGMIPAIASDSNERSVYTALGTFTGSIGYNGITVVVVPIVSYFSFKFTGSHTESQSGWTAFAIITALLGVLTAWTVAFGTKENESALRSKAQKNGNPLQAFAALAKNDQLLWVALSYLLYAVANVATNGVMFYLFKFVLGMPDSFSIAGVIPVITGLIMAPAFPVLNRWIPRRFLFIVGMALMIAGYLLFSVAATSLPVVIIALILFYLPATFIQMTAILCLTDSIEYGQLKTGRRNEAVTLSVRPMLDKIAGALSNGIVGFIAVAAGMTGTATAADMTASNISTFKTFAFYVPLAFIVLSLLVFLFTVKIDEKMHAQIVTELEEKLGTESIEADE